MFQIKKYCRRRYIVHAARYCHDSDTLYGLSKFMNGVCVTRPNKHTGTYEVVIKNSESEGEITAQQGDYIIKDKKGYFSVCTAKVFGAIYDLA